MKRTYKSGAQKQRDKKKKLAEAARNSRSLSSWLGHQSRRIQSETSEKAARNRDGSTTAQADWVSSATVEAEQVSLATAEAEQVSSATAEAEQVSSATVEAEQVSSATAEAEPVNEDVSRRTTQSMYRCCKISISIARSRRKTPKKRNDPCTVKSSSVERFVLKNGAP